MSDKFICTQAISTSMELEGKECRHSFLGVGASHPILPIKLFLSPLVSPFQVIPSRILEKNFIIHSITPPTCFYKCVPTRVTELDIMCSHPSLDFCISPYRFLACNIMYPAPISPTSGVVV